MQAETLLLLMRGDPHLLKYGPWMQNEEKFPMITGV